MGKILSALKRRRKTVIAIVSVVLVAAVAVSVCAAYLGDYYRADMAAIEAFSTSNETVAKQTLQDGTVAYIPATATKGLIFYPGGKVEHTAYLPLMESLASKGVLCVLVSMPFRLAVLDSNAADGIPKQYPQITEWYIGGHSLGGAMAASYVAKHTDEYKGLILLGAYSTVDLSDSGLSVMSMYGSEDGVLNREKYAENKPNLPKDCIEITIAGGCHAYFGMYGPQEGDGTPSITNDLQISLASIKIAAMIAGENG